MKDEAIQLLANLYPTAIPAVAYEDVVGIVAILLRSEMFRRKTLKDGVWIDAQTGQQESDSDRVASSKRFAEMLASKEPPAGIVSGSLQAAGKRAYDLPSAKQIRDLENEDAARYPKVRDTVAKTQVELSSGKLQVHDSALTPEEMGKPMIRVPGRNGGEILVPTHRVPESEIRRIEAASAAREAEKSVKFQEVTGDAPGSVQVGMPKSVATPAWDRHVSYSDVLNGPSMQKPF